PPARTDAASGAPSPGPATARAPARARGRLGPPRIGARDRSLRHQVHDGEDHDPHDVDEVPVKACDLDALGVGLREAALSRESPHRHEPTDPSSDVRAMEAGQDIEGRTKQVGVEVESLTRELRELEHLTADESRAEHRGREDPDAEASVVAALDGS